MAVDEERFVAAARNSVKRRKCRERNDIPQGTWLGGAQPAALLRKAFGWKTETWDIR